MSADDLNQRSTPKHLLRSLFFPVSILWTILVHIVDKLLLGGRLEKRESEKLRQQFAKEIRERTPSLFVDFAGRIVPNFEDYIPAFDFAAVTVAVEDMVLLFSRCRSAFRVDVTPANKPTAWREIALVVRNSDLSADSSQSIGYSGLNDFGNFFQKNVEIIRHEVRKADWRAPGFWLRPI